MENMFLCNALLYSIVSFSTYLSSTQNIFRFIVDHKDSDYAVFQHQLESTDLTNKLQITNALVKDIIQRYENMSFDNDNPLIITDKGNDGTMIDIEQLKLDKVPSPIQISIMSTIEVTNKIHTLLETIQHKIKVHQSSYIRSMIKINIGLDINKLIALTNIFNQRLELLIHLLAIYN
jgi:hypothetical protein